MRSARSDMSYYTLNKGCVISPVRDTTFMCSSTVNAYNNILDQQKSLYKYQLYKH